MSLTKICFVLYKVHTINVMLTLGNKMIFIKNNALLTSLLMVSLTFFLSTSIYAQEQQNYHIPTPEDANIFAEFTDELPAVINYYTKQDEQQIIDFYQAKYGQAISSEMKKGRLTLHFNYVDKKLRVIISVQGNSQQVDILLQ